jgi:hypothetical protein
MQRWIPRFLLVLIMLLAVVVYRPGLNGPFIFDDGANIVHNTALDIKNLHLSTLKQAAFSVPSGPLMRPISMVSFALNYYTTDHSGGLNPYYFKLTNLVIHLVNGIGIFILTSLVMNFYRKRFAPGLSSTHAQWLSLVVAAAWLLHPFNLTSVLYTVQRMTSLSALFSIWGLVVFLWGRTRLYEGKSGILAILAGVLLFMPLATLSKETGALLPALMLVAEVSLFAFHTEKPFARRFLIGFYAIFVVIPFVVVLTYIALHPDWLLTGYKTRVFTLPDRLMTELRVLWFYIWQILLPSTVQMGLYHDDIVISRGLFTPVSTVLSLAGMFVLLALTYILRRKAPMFTFGVLFFLVGQLLESTVWPLEIAHEHRNYLPMYGILLVLFYYFLYPLRYANNLRLRQTVVALLIGLFAFNTYSRASAWTDRYNLFQMEVEHHPDSALANGEMGAIYSSMASPDPRGMENSYTSARQYFNRAAILDKNDTKPLFGLIFLSSNRGKVVEPDWLQQLSHRLESAPYAANTSDKLLTLTRCQLQGDCKLTNTEFENLLQAALRNPTLVGSNRAKVLYAHSSYLINVERDYSAALNDMHDMVQAAPQEVEYRFAMINFLTALRRFGEAKEQLAILKRLDTLQDHSEEITLQEQTLFEQENKSQHHK